MTLNLWTEIVASGFFYLLAISFLVLKLLKVNNLSFLSTFKEYWAFVSVGIVVTSYLMGIIAHRLVPLLFGPFARLIDKRIFRKAMLLTGPQEYNLEIYYIRVLQYGSERLHRELDFQFSTLTLFRQLIVVIPFLGVSAAVWLIDTIEKRLFPFVLIVSVVLEVGVFIAYRRQRTHYSKTRDAAFAEIKNLQNKQKKSSIRRSI